MEDLRGYSQPLKYVHYIKNPCLTFLVISEDQEDLKLILNEIRIPGQPYIFALDKNEHLFEVQIYSQKIVPIQRSEKAMERRIDFNGAFVKVVILDGDLLLRFLPLVQKQLNFTIEKVKYKGYGSYILGWGVEWSNKTTHR